MALKEIRIKSHPKEKKTLAGSLRAGVMRSTPEPRAMSATDVPVRDKRVKYKVVPCIAPIGYTPLKSV